MTIESILVSDDEAMNSVVAVAEKTVDDRERNRGDQTTIDFKMVTFSLSGKDYIMNVKEIAKAGNFTYVPNTLPFVIGVYNLRGEIIPILDMRLFFNIALPASSSSELENLLIHLKDLGLNGIEVYHSTHSDEDKKKLNLLAKKYNLFPTGGSDFHGAHKPGLNIGIGYGDLKVPYTILEDILAQNKY